jgi:polysaccharide export outer membrane protein
MIVLAGAFGLANCGGNRDMVPPEAEIDPSISKDYLIGPGDQLDIFVWRNAELSTKVPVRPDGRISIPLIDDLQAAGKTPTQLGRDIESRLTQYVQEPVVTVIVTGFLGPFGEQIRIVGAGVAPRAIPYRENMTLLDAVIEVGGLNEFAAGNSAKVWRRRSGENNVFRVRLDDLLKDGDLSANVALIPGDVIIVPQSWF